MAAPEGNMGHPDMETWTPELPVVVVVAVGSAEEVPATQGTWFPILRGKKQR